MVLRCAMPGAGYYGIAARGAGITVLRCAMPGAGYYGIVARDARRRALRMRNVKALHFQSKEEYTKNKTKQQYQVSSNRDSQGKWQKKQVTGKASRAASEIGTAQPRKKVGQISTV